MLQLCVYDISLKILEIIVLGFPVMSLFLIVLFIFYTMLIGTERGVRVNAIRRALYETFPEPNCRLLKR